MASNLDPELREFFLSSLGANSVHLSLEWMDCFWNKPLREVYEGLHQAKLSLEPGRNLLWVSRLRPSLSWWKTLLFRNDEVAASVVFQPLSLDHFYSPEDWKLVAEVTAKKINLLYQAIILQRS